MKSHFNCKFDIDEEERIVALYAFGTSTNQLANECMTSHNTIKSILKRHGVETRTRAQAFTKLQNARKHSLDEQFFDSIDNEQKAYWLGMLFADGWMTERTYGISLGSVDEDHIDKFRESIQATNPIRKHKNQNNCTYEITLNSKKLYNALLNHGCLPKKSLILQFPSCVPDNLLHHFIRGYWDGDGYIGIDKRGNLDSSVVGTLSMMTGISDTLTGNGRLPKVKARKNKNVYVLGYRGNWNCFLLRLYLYKNATVYLQRKKDILFSTLPSNRKKRLGLWGIQVVAFAMQHPEFPIEHGEIFLT